ncbi:MAG: VWA domain-containing protein [Terracidiphilus sp.]|nr:VWA domain-containing protein [Terracidiphilus sp.]MDR3799447.1 VWA domain-containing protein [Terracidiphilus sp.]
MTTIRTSSDLVVVDVVASDSQQNPVHKLTTADFTLLEDGKPQTVKVFEEHQTQTSAPLPPAPKLDPGVFTNYSVAPANGALNILLLDKLNTPMDAQTEVRDQVLKYLKQVPPGTRIAIFSLTTELKLLQGFTSNPELLRALVAGKKGTQGASPLMNNAVEGDQAGADDPMYDTMADALGNEPDAAMILANLQQFEVEQQSFQLQLRARYTLDALNQLARYMSALPGRKNLIWFSGSFPVNIMPDPDLLQAASSISGPSAPDPFAGVASMADEFRETVDLLARSQVAVYPIDARGLMVAPMLSVTQSGSTMSRKPNGFANANTKFFQQTSEEHGTMEQMAEATGGKAFVNTNGLKEAVEKAINAGSNYYTIAYTPTNRKWNGDYRKIQVKLDRSGVTLAYRRGYFADDPNAPAQKSQAQNAKPDPGQYSALRAAMLHGGPEPTELIFAASVRAASTDTEAELVPGNQADKKISGPYRRYAVTFMANPKELIWTVTPDGAHRCALEFMTFVYDANGARINAQYNGIGAAIPDARFASVQNGNIKYVQQISVPVKGEYYLRLGIRDNASDHVGAVEFPVATVAKLPAVDVPLPAAAPPPK